MSHTLQIIISGRELSLIIDSGKAQRVSNSGKIDKFKPDIKQNLYLGGLPVDLAQKAVLAFHLKQTQSFKGFNKIYLTV